MPKDCNPRRKKSGESDAQYRKRCGPRPLGQIKMGEKRIQEYQEKKDNIEVLQNTQIYTQMRIQREL